MKFGPLQPLVGRQSRIVNTILTLQTMTAWVENELNLAVKVITTFEKSGQISSMTPSLLSLIKRPFLPIERVSQNYNLCKAMMNELCNNKV